MPTIYGGGETGEECIAVASAAVVLNTCDLYATSSRETACSLPALRTRPPSNTTSSAPQPIMPAAISQMRVLSSAQAFSTALPVIYVVEDA